MIKERVVKCVGKGLFLLSFCLVSGCADGGSSHRPLNAVAHCKPTENNRAEGTVTFTVVPEGIKVVADIHGLTPGEHGFHVHEKGDCSAKDASSAGGHFNPTGSKHGGPESAERHVGDLGNLVADAEGHAHYERVDKKIALEGKNSIIGKSLVIHAQRDDFVTQPTGDSGARVACGLIVEK